MSRVAQHRSREQLEEGLGRVRGAPKDVGTVELIVRRPEVGEREVLQEAELDPSLGVVGDNWSTRKAVANPEMQLNLMSARVVDLVSDGDRERWALAGDQLYVDLDLSEEHLPAGTRLALGSAVIEVTPPPHTGCAKFVARFGADAHRFVNAKEHRALRLRGLCAKVVQAGTVRPGDEIRKLA